MPRVVPSQVVTFIDTLWPTTDQQKNINALQAGRLSGLVELADEVPGRVPAAVAALVGIARRLVASDQAVIADFHVTRQQEEVFRFYVEVL